MVETVWLSYRITIKSLLLWFLILIISFCSQFESINKIFIQNNCNFFQQKDVSHFHVIIEFFSGWLESYRGSSVLLNKTTCRLLLENIDESC